MSSLYGVGRQPPIITLVLMLCGSPIYSHAEEADQQLDVDQIVSSYVASLESLRNKPLRIRADAVPTPSVSDYKISQTLLLLMDSGNLRCEDTESKGGVVFLRGVTCILSDRYIAAVNDKRSDWLSVHSYLNMPDNCFNRSIWPFWGSDYLGISSPIWRAKCHDLARLLPTLKLVGRRDTFDDMDVIVLQGSSEDIVLTVWVSPSLNYCPKKIEYKPKMPDNVTADNLPSHKLYTCVFNQFQKLGNSYVPQQIDVHFVTAGYYVRDGKVKPNRTIDVSFDVTWTTEIVSAALNDDDFGVAMDIPDGTRVQMDDAPRLRFVWRDGEVVPVTE